MTKTISLEASKKLQEYMPEKTEYTLDDTGEILYFDNQFEVVQYKTLTLEEAIDMLPASIEGGGYSYRLEFGKYFCRYKNIYGEIYEEIGSENIIQAIEEMLIFLADNNLLK